ncbi:hypothetical protein ON010_g13004 [Phytophthora cinnamomi]|nr:hypothetical protein ON010_g13004 [Phytophthora cinnamomi]
MRRAARERIVLGIHPAARHARRLRHIRVVGSPALLRLLDLTQAVDVPAYLVQVEAVEVRVHALVGHLHTQRPARGQRHRRGSSRSGAAHSRAVHVSLESGSHPGQAVEVPHKLVARGRVLELQLRAEGAERERLGVQILAHALLLQLRRGLSVLVASTAANSQSICLREVVEAVPGVAGDGVEQVLVIHDGAVLEPRAFDALLRAEGSDGGGGCIDAKAARRPRDDGPDSG